MEAPVEGTYCFCNGVRLSVFLSVCLCNESCEWKIEKNCNNFEILIIKLLIICRRAPGILYFNRLDNRFSAIDYKYALKTVFTENLLARFA